MSSYNYPPDIFDKGFSPSGSLLEARDQSLFIFRTKYYSTLCLYSDQLPETLREPIYQTNPILTTQKKYNSQQCILIFDSYRNYISDDFLLYYQEYKIIPVQLPLYSTHLLQPLDISIFQPLKHQCQISIIEII